MLTVVVVALAVVADTEAAVVVVEGDWAPQAPSASPAPRNRGGAERRPVLQVNCQLG